MLPQIQNSPMKCSLFHQVFCKKLRLKPGNFLQSPPALYSTLSTSCSCASGGPGGGRCFVPGGQWERRVHHVAADLLQLQDSLSSHDPPCQMVGPEVQKTRLQFNRKQGLQEPVFQANGVRDQCNLSMWASCREKFKHPARRGFYLA